MTYLMLAASGPFAAILTAVTLRAVLFILGGQPSATFVDASTGLSVVVGGLTWWCGLNIVATCEKAGRL